MAVQLILKNSSVEDRRPTAAQLTTGELALNYNEEGAFLSCKDSAGNIQQVGGVKIAEAAPSAPVEQTLWFQPSTRELRVYNGSSWAAVSATILPDSIVNADVNASAAIAGTKISPDFGSQAVTTTGLISADGKVSFPLGTAALPSLYPGSDTNTGIYSPGADQVAISTNGTQRLAIDSLGNVGIGTSSPSFDLEVADTSGDCVVALNSPNGNNTEILFGDPDSSYSGRIRYGHSTNYLQFNTNSSERLRIDSSGDVLIGGTLPSAPNISLNGSDGSATFAGNLTIADKIIHNGDTNTAVRFPANDTVSVETAGSERLRIDSSGKVGIGTTSPVEKLSIEDPTAAKIKINKQFYSGLQIGQNSDQTSEINQVTTADLLFKIANTEAFRVDTSRRLLVGTSTTLGNNATLQTSGQQVNYQAFYSATAQAGPFVILSKSNGTQASPTIVTNNDYLGIIGFSGYDGTDYATRGAEIAAMVDGTPGSNDMPGRLVFSTTADGASSPTERMRIDSSGDVLIGGTLPASPNITLNAADGSAEFAGKLVSASTVSGDTGTTLATKDYVDSSGGGAVDSVNTQTGVVSLGIEDMDDFELQPATGTAPITRTGATNQSSNVASGNVGLSIQSSGYTYWSTNPDGLAGTVLDYLVNTATFPIDVDISGTTYTITGIDDDSGSATPNVRLDHTAGVSLTNGVSYTLGLAAAPTLPLQNNDILQWVDSESKFKPAQLPAAVLGIPQNAQTSAYTLVSSDNGKHISITTGGVTVPSAVFSVGDTISIYNNSAADQTITQGASVTLRFAGTVNTGNRTLAQRGLVTVLCVGSNEFVISGGGLS